MVTNSFVARIVFNLIVMTRMAWAGPDGAGMCVWNRESVAAEVGTGARAEKSNDGGDENASANGVVEGARLGMLSILGVCMPVAVSAVVIRLSRGAMCVV